MDEQRVREYLNLIQELLGCPSGEELDVLQANAELVDADLISVMEQVAAQMAEGDEEAAGFLQDLAAQLQEGFVEAAKVMDVKGDTPTEVYLDLIEGLLNCADGEAVVQLLNANVHLVDSGLVQTMAQVATILEEKGEVQAAELLFSMASQIAEAI